MYLQMFLKDALIDEVHLNYNGLQQPLEKEWYHQGTIKYLAELHEEQIADMNVLPSFLLVDRH